MNAYPEAIPAVAWIYGSVYTDGWATAVPGYRTIKVGASTYTMASGAAQPYWFWEWLTALDTAIGGGWGLALSGSTWTLGGGAPAVITWLDRTGWLLGFDSEPGDSEPSDDEHQHRVELSGQREEQDDAGEQRVPQAHRGQHVAQPQPVAEHAEQRRDQGADEQQ